LDDSEEGVFFGLPRLAGWVLSPACTGVAVWFAEIAADGVFFGLLLLAG
jgi:hypothetical protein